MINKIKLKIYKLLRKSEKWTQTDMVYLASGGFWLTSNKFVGTITAFILAIAYANLLSKDTYATYKYVLSIISILGIFTLAGINTAITRSVAMGYEATIKLATKIKIRWALIGSSIGICISAYYYLNENYILGLSILAASIILPVQNSFLYAPYLNGNKYFKTISVYNSIKNISIAAILLVVLFFSPNVFILILALYGGNTIIQATLNYITFKRHKINDKIDKKSLTYGKHLSLMSVLGIISEQLDKIFLWHLLGPTQLAIYAFAMLPVEQIKSFIKTIATLSIPKLAVQNKNILKRTLPNKIFKFLLISLPIVVIYISISPFIFKIFFPNYLNSIIYSQIFAISILLFPLRFFSTAILAQGNKKILYKLNIILPIIKIILLTSLIPLLGTMGAIIALILSSVINDFISFLYFKKI